MAIIYSYPTVTPESGDLIVGTDITGKVTKNFTVGSIVSTEIPTYITGTANTVPLFTSDDTIGNSIITQNTTGDKISIEGNLNLNGPATSFFSSDGLAAVNLNVVDAAQGNAIDYFMISLESNGSGKFYAKDLELGDGEDAYGGALFSIDSPNNKFLFNNGDVGIGTTTPSSKLDVVDTRTSLSGVTSASPADAVFNTINLAHTADAPEARCRATVSELVNSSSFSSFVNTASRSTAKATGSGDIAALYGASNWSIVEGTGNYTFSTGALNWSRIDNPSATVANVSGTHSEVQLAQGTVGNINIFDLDFDQSAGTTITGDFNYINVKNESPINISGTARALNIESTLPSYLAGDVGIGTTTPSSKLDVNGTVSISNTGTSSTLNLKSSSTAPGGNYIHAKKSDNSNQWVLGSNSASTDSVVLKQYNDADIIFQNNNGDAMTINSNSYVGIGTTNPQATLDVNGVIAMKGTEQLLWDNNNGTLDIAPSVGQVKILTGVITIDYNSNVGINTTSPVSRLHVNGGDVEVDDSTSGLILKSPNGTRYRIKVDNSGNLTTTAV